MGHQRCQGGTGQRICHDQHPIEPLFHVAGTDHDAGRIEAADRLEHRPPRRDQPVEGPGRRLRRLAVRMDGIIEQLHVQATLPRVRQRFCDTIEDATIAAAGDAPLEGELEMLVLLARDEVNGVRLRHRAEHALLADPAARRKGGALIAAPGLRSQRVQHAHVLLSVLAASPNITHRVRVWHRHRTSCPRGSKQHQTRARHQACPRDIPTAMTLSSPPCSSSVPHPWRIVRRSSGAVVWHGGACEPLRHDGTRATNSRLWHTMRTIHTTRHPYLCSRNAARDTVAGAGALVPSGSAGGLVRRQAPRQRFRCAPRHACQ